MLEPGVRWILGAAVGMAVLTVVFLVFGVRWRRWPQTDGTVVRFDPGPGGDSGIDELSVIAYRTAGGYAGEHARGRLQHEQLGARVRLRWHPRRPERSVEVGSEFTYALSSVGAVFALCGFAAAFQYLG